MSEAPGMSEAPVSLPGVPAPRVDEGAYVAPGARVVGDVTLEPGSSVWYNAVLRAEVEPIVLGERSNLQDNVSVHVDRGFPVRVGRDVSVGHNAVLHGCTVEDGALVGMGAVVLNGAVIGASSLVAAGAVVPEGAQVPPRSLVAGVPARVRRELTDAEVEGLRVNAEHYVGNAELHRRGAGADA